MRVAEDNELRHGGGPGKFVDKARTAAEKQPQFKQQSSGAAGQSAPTKLQLHFTAASCICAQSAMHSGRAAQVCVGRDASRTEMHHRWAEQILIAMHTPHLHKVPRTQCTREHVQRAHNSNCCVQMAASRVNGACIRLHECGSVRPCGLGAQDTRQVVKPSPRINPLCIVCNMHTMETAAETCLELTKMHDQHKQHFTAFSTNETSAEPRELCSSPHKSK